MYHSESDTLKQSPRDNKASRIQMLAIKKVTY